MDTYLYTGLHFVRMELSRKLYGENLFVCRFRKIMADKETNSEFRQAGRYNVIQGL